MFYKLITVIRKLKNALFNIYGKDRYSINIYPDKIYSELTKKHKSGRETIIKIFDVKRDKKVKSELQRGGLL